MIKIGIFGVCASLLALILKKNREDFAIVLVFAGGIIIFTYIFAQLKVIIDFLQSLCSQLPIQQKQGVILLKMIGITYVGEFSANLCRDAGYSSIASQIELFAKLALLILGIPAMATLLDVFESFV